MENYTQQELNQTLKHFKNEDRAKEVCEFIHKVCHHTGCPFDVSLFVCVNDEQFLNNGIELFKEPNSMTFEERINELSALNDKL